MMMKRVWPATTQITTSYDEKWDNNCMGLVPQWWMLCELIYIIISVVLGCILWKELIRELNKLKKLMNSELLVRYEVVVSYSVFRGYENMDLGFRLWYVYDVGELWMWARGGHCVDRSLLDVCSEMMLECHLDMCVLPWWQDRVRGCSSEMCYGMEKWIIRLCC